MTTLAGGHRICRSLFAQDSATSIANGNIHPKVPGSNGEIEGDPIGCGKSFWQRVPMKNQGGQQFLVKSARGLAPM